MRIIITSLVVILNFVFYTTVFRLLAIGGVIPNTPLILVVSYSLLRGRKESAIIGVGTGMLFDMFFGTHFCFYTVVYPLIGYIVGKNQPEFYRENYILPVFFCLFATGMYEVVHFAEQWLFQQGGSLIHFLFQILVPMAVYTGVCTIPVYRLLFGLDEWLISKERYRYRLF